MRMKYFLLLLIGCFGSVLLVFSQRKIPCNALQNGDLLFIVAKRSNLSGAINRVTQKNKQQSYDHVAIIEKTGDSVLYVLEASSKKGSIRTRMDSFCLEQKKDNREIAVYRLRDAFQYTIAHAIPQAKRLLGKPYNWSYILDDSSYYCSDFVERAFRSDTVFHLQPMHFVNPKTGQIDAYWKDFYKKQNREVPEGELGCNPNGLAASPKLSFIGWLNLADTQ